LFAWAKNCAVPSPLNFKFSWLPDLIIKKSVPPIPVVNSALPVIFKLPVIKTSFEDVKYVPPSYQSPSESVLLDILVSRKGFNAIW
jgi:hypothetical protein